MYAVISRAWRVARAASVFAVFAVVSLILGSLVMPLSVALRRHGVPAHVPAQRWIHRGYRFLMWLFTAAGLAAVRVEGQQHLQGSGPLLILANHPSLLDMVVLGALLPQTDCVVQADWADLVFLRGIVRAADYIVAEEGPRTVDDAVRRLGEGRTLVMFPEGTRSPAEGLGPFYRAAAHVALRSGAPLVLAIIRWQALPPGRGQRWTDVPDEPMVATVRILAPISPTCGLDGTESRPVAARLLTAALRERIDKELLP